MLELLLAPVLVFLITLSLAWGLKSFAHKLRLVAVSSTRSSHTGEVATSSGISLALVVLIAAIFLYPSAVSIWVGLAFVFGALGFADDIFDLPARWKLIIQLCLLVVWMALWGPKMISWEFLQFSGDFSGLLLFLPVVMFAWVINAHNFMDGIDGFALIQSIFVFCSGGILMFHSGFLDLASLAFILAAGCAALLIFNLRPPGLFIGDSGSLLLGASLCCLMLLSWQRGSDWLFYWLILNSVFLVDATLTLLRRLLNGANCFAPHRTHLYQLLDAKLGVISVNMVLLSLNLGLVLPALLLAYDGYFSSSLVFVMLVAILSICYVMCLVVGIREQQSEDLTPKVIAGSMLGE